MFGFGKKTPTQAATQATTAAQQGQPAPNNQNQSHQTQNAAQTAYNQTLKDQQNK